MAAPDRIVGRPVSRRTFWSELSRNPALLVWCAFVGSMPFYAGPSGMPQPGNALIFVLVPLTVSGWSGRFDPAFARTFRALVWFTLWVCAVNFAWVVVSGKLTLYDYAIFPVYYIFNAAVVFCAFVLHRRFGELFVRATTYMVLITALFQVSASFVHRGADPHRVTLFFNNPNQLGYWALLAACLITLTQRRIGLRLAVAGLGLTGCAYLAILSASRAAIGGVALLIILMVFSNPRVIVFAMIAALGLVNVGGPLADALEMSERRARHDRDPKTSFVDERGYDRLWEHPEHLLLGAGEGDLGRFTEEGEAAHEIHSSAATVLFSYGVVGTVLFLMFLFRLLARIPLRALLMLGPTLGYTIAHQGLRFTMLWVLLAVVAALKPSAVPRRPSPAVAHAGASRPGPAPRSQVVLP